MNRYAHCGVTISHSAHIRSAVTVNIRTATATATALIIVNAQRRSTLRTRSSSRFLFALSDTRLRHSAPLLFTLTEFANERFQRAAIERNGRARMLTAPANLLAQLRPSRHLAYCCRRIVILLL